MQPDRDRVAEGVPVELVVQQVGVVVEADPLHRLVGRQPHVVQRHPRRPHPRVEAEGEEDDEERRDVEVRRPRHAGAAQAAGRAAPARRRAGGGDGSRGHRCRAYAAVSQPLGRGVEGVAEGGVRVGAVLDVGQLRREGVLDLRVVEPDRQDRHLRGDAAEDLADRRVAEVRVRRVEHRRLGGGVGVGREVAALRRRRPHLHLLRRGRQPLDEGDGGVDVRAVGGHAEPRAAPVGCAAGQHRGDVPLAGVVGPGLALDVAHHPARAGDRRERAARERLVPVVGERLQAGGDAVLRRLGGVPPCRLHARAVLRVGRAVGRGVGIFALVDGRREDARRAVDEVRVGGLGRRVLVGLAEGDEVVPRRPRLGELGRVGLDAGLVEEILAVADRLRADVGPEADGRRAVLRARLRPLPVVELGLQIRRLGRSAKFTNWSA